MKKTNYDPFTLVEYQLLKQGRGSYSDGWNWLRAVIGAFFTAIIVTLLVLNFPENNSFSIVLIVICSIGGAGSAAAWIVKCDNQATVERISELEKISCESK